MIFGAILAGGTGSRMNIADMPKQFLPLGGQAHRHPHAGEVFAVRAV